MARRSTPTTVAAAVLVALALSVSAAPAFAAEDEELMPPEEIATSPTEARPAPTPETADPASTPDDADQPAADATMDAEGADNPAPEPVDPSLAPVAPSPAATAGAESPPVDDAVKPQVHPRPFDVPLARVYTGMPGAVIEVRGSLPAFDAGVYAVTDAERSALEALCDAWSERPEVGCIAALAHSVTAIAPGNSADSEVARYTAKRVQAAAAIRDQLARNADSGIPAIPVDGVLRLVADDDGFVALPQGVVEAAVTLPFTGDEEHDGNAFWRTGTFTLRPEVASLSGVDLVNAMFNATWSGWYTGGGGAGQGAFIEEITNGDGTARWIGQWGVGPQLAVDASRVPLVDPPAPEPEPTAATATTPPTATPAAMAPEGKALAETGGTTAVGLIAGLIGAAAVGAGALLVVSRCRLGGAR
ncbi:hypothetical protein [Microbacterium laevaniformans]|uniref:hypothetical protein n=1 Tax=Microbacterium laevaniformans TaxID=36807 RepID=UPI003D958901